MPLCPNRTCQVNGEIAGSRADIQTVVTRTDAR